MSKAIRSKENLAQSLKLRAQQSLINKDEITDELVAKAANDALELASNKSPAFSVLEDLAYIRLKLYLKISLDADDELFYKQALKAIENAPLISPSGELKGARFYASKRREEIM